VEAVRWFSQGEALVPKDDLIWLSATERQRLAGMAYTKRRVEYLLSRWTAKLALAAVEGRPTGLSSLAAIEVNPASDGAPVACLDGQPLSRRVSLTDRAGWSVCAVSPSGLEVGCDLELVEHRSLAFVADYFTPAEQALAHAAPSELDWQRVSNLIWSAKESALKVLRTGLRRNTRSVEVSLGNGDGDDWVPLTVRSAEGSTFYGWWRQYGTFILTVAALEPLAPPVALEDPPALANAAPLHSWLAQPRW
jgi:4'-phosphopantetheinyl transferase